MSKEDVEKILKETGRGMTLEELASAAGISKGTIQQNVNALWNEHKVSRIYKFNELNIRYVYYFMAAACQATIEGWRNGHEKRLYRI